MAATDFDYEWMDSTTNVRCRAKEGGRGWARPGALSSTSEILPHPSHPFPLRYVIVLGGEPHDPPKTPWGQGKGREGEVRLHRGHSDVHEGVARRVRRPVGGHASAPLSSSSSVVLVSRLLRPSPCSQVRWKCLTIVPCKHKLTGWEEAAMGGRRVAGGRDGGGWALAEERRSSPMAHPSLPPHPKDLVLELHHGRLLQPVVEGDVVEAGWRSAAVCHPRTLRTSRERVVGVATERRLQPLLMGPGRIDRNRLLRPFF